MKKTITKNFTYNLIHQIILLLSPLITVPYLARTLKAESLGIYSYTTSFTTYIILIGSLGLNLYAEREISINRDNKYERSKIFKEILILKTISLIISIIIYNLVMMKSTYVFYFRLLTLEIIGNIFDINFFYQGLEEARYLVKRNVAIKLLYILSIFIFVKKESDLSIYILIYCLTTLFGNISLWFNLKKYITNISILKLNIVRHVKNSLKIFISQILSETYFLLDNIMIGIITNDMKQVGYYYQAQKIIRIFLVIFTALNKTISPRIAKLQSEQKYKKVSDYIYSCINFVLFFSIPTILILDVLASKFIPLFLGNEFNPIIILIYISSALILLIGITNVIGNDYLLQVKQETKYNISIILGILFSVIINIILTKEYRSLGATIATLCGNIIVTFIQIFYIRDKIKMKKIIKLSKNYLVASVVMVVCMKTTEILSNNLLSLLFELLLGIIVYLSMLSFLKDEFYKKYKNLPNKYINNLFRNN